MTIKKQISESGKEITISIEQRFDFAEHKSFRDAYINCTQEGSTFILDLSHTSYMDSSALGMILLLKDHAEGLKGKVVIFKPNDSVYKILEIAQFHRLLEIEKS